MKKIVLLLVLASGLFANECFKKQDEFFAAVNIYVYTEKKTADMVSDVVRTHKVQKEVCNFKAQEPSTRHLYLKLIDIADKTYERIFPSLGQI